MATSAIGGTVFRGVKPSMKYSVGYGIGLVKSGLFSLFLGA